MNLNLKLILAYEEREKLRQKMKESARKLWGLDDEIKKLEEHLGVKIEN